MPLLATTHLDLLVKSIPPLLEQLSFCLDLTGSNLSLPKGYNKLTSEGHNSMGQGQGLGRLVVINVTSLEVELKWKGLVVRHHCSLSNLLKNIYNYQAAFQMYTYSRHPTLKKNSNWQIPSEVIQHYRPKTRKAAEFYLKIPGWPCNRQVTSRHPSHKTEKAFPALPEWH